VSSPAAQSWLLLICLPCRFNDAIVVCVCFACLKNPADAFAVLAVARWALLGGLAVWSLHCTQHPHTTATRLLSGTENALGPQALPVLSLPLLLLLCCRATA
jgi:hypothetical protein